MIQSTKGELLSVKIGQDRRGNFDARKAQGG